MQPQSLYCFIKERKITAMTSEEDHKDPFLKTAVRADYVTTKSHILITNFLMIKD